MSIEHRKTIRFPDEVNKMIVNKVNRGAATNYSDAVILLVERGYGANLSISDLVRQSDKRVFREICEEFDCDSIEMIGVIIDSFIRQWRDNHDEEENI